MLTNAKDLNERFTKGMPAIVDIMPTLARFLDINIPVDKLREIDGVPLIGKISATNPNAVWRGDVIYITWKPISKKGMVKIWIILNDHFRVEGTDKYMELNVKNVPVAAGKVEIHEKKYRFIKIVLEMPDNYLNRWVIRETDYRID